MSVKRGEIAYPNETSELQQQRVVDWAKQEVQAAWDKAAAEPVKGSDADSGAFLEHWEDPHSPWDVLVLGDSPLPGVWSIESADRRLVLDRKKSKGKDGSRIRDLGQKESMITARGSIITRADWQALQARLEKINPRAKGKERAPLRIYHPAVAITGITTVYLQAIRAPRINSGILEISLQFAEWTPTPKEAKSSDLSQKDQEHAQFLANMLVVPGDEPLYGYGVHMPKPWQKEYEEQEAAKASAGGEHDALAAKEGYKRVTPKGYYRKKTLGPADQNRPSDSPTSPTSGTVNAFGEYKRGSTY